MNAYWSRRSVRPRWHSLAAAMLVVFAAGWSLLVLPAQARKPEKTAGAYNSGDKEVELFEGMRSGQLEVKFIPRNARQAKIIIRNRADEPLNVRLPDVFAARPVLAQIGGPLGGLPGGLRGGVQGGGAASGTQAVGGGIGGGVNGGNLGQGNFNQGWGFFNVAAGKQAQLKVACVCLEFGKPDPRPSVEYELVELATVCDKPELAEVLRTLAVDECSQTVAQAASWHLANDLAWEQMAVLVRRRPAGLSEPMFRSEDLKQARALAEPAGTSQLTSRAVTKTP